MAASSDCVLGGHSAASEHQLCLHPGSYMPVPRIRSSGTEPSCGSGTAATRVRVIVVVSESDSCDESESDSCDESESDSSDESESDSSDESESESDSSDEWEW